MLHYMDLQYSMRLSNTQNGQIDQNQFTTTDQVLLKLGFYA